MLPSAANIDMITAPNNTTPKAIEAATYNLGKERGHKRTAQHRSAEKTARQQPEKTKMMRPTPTPIYFMVWAHVRYMMRTSF
jgi:hypothetical protein